LFVAVVVKKSINEQARYFLERYMDEFTGRWEEVLDQAEEFRKFDHSNRDGELQEQEFLVYMEKRGEAMTPIQLRETLKVWKKKEEKERCWLFDVYFCCGFVRISTWTRARGCRSLS
jgi:hypothetical protein